MRRIQIELTCESYKALESLQEASGQRTKKDLVVAALAFFEWVIAERRAGRRILSVDDQDQNRKEAILPFWRA